MSKINIEIVGPEYLGAPYPAFEKKAINESRFDFEDRFKIVDEAWVDPAEGKARVTWISQESEHPGSLFVKEVVRAVKANAPGPCKLVIKFRSRDTCKWNTVRRGWKK